MCPKFQRCIASTSLILTPTASFVSMCPATFCHDNLYFSLYKSRRYRTDRPAFALISVNPCTVLDTMQIYDMLSRSRPHKSPFWADLEDKKHAREVEEHGNAVNEDEGPPGTHAIEHEREHRNESCSD